MEDMMMKITETYPDDTSDILRGGRRRFADVMDQRLSDAELVKKLHAFTEPEISLSCSEEPATKPDQCTRFS